MKKPDSPYCCIVFLWSGSPLKYQYVRNVVALSLWLDSHFPNWNYINVYNRKSKQYLERATKGSFINQFPTL